MSVVQIETITEISNGQAWVEAVKPDTMMERDHQLVGFFVRGRRGGDRFEIAKWEDFSPRWMRFVDVPPEGWLDKINAREKLRGQIDALSQSWDLGDERADDSMRAYSQLPSQRTSGDFDYGRGKMKKRR